MTIAPEKQIERIRKMVEKEFPDDPALQQVHIARKLIAQEAAQEGVGVLDYIRRLPKRVKAV